MFVFTFGPGTAQASHFALLEPLTVYGRNILGTLWFSQASTLYQARVAGNTLVRRITLICNVSELLLGPRVSTGGGWGRSSSDQLKTRVKAS